jgi:hypothetical protein
LAIYGYSIWPGRKTSTSFLVQTPQRLHNVSLSPVAL